MPKTKYCIAQQCENFTGTTIHMFRFPKESEEKKDWINAINKNNDEKHKSIGIGWLCHLHFSPNDIQNVKGRLQLKRGAIPVNFIVSINQPVLDSDSNNTSKDTDIEQSCDLQRSCNNCDTLFSECNELKRNLLKTEIDFDCEKQKKNLQLEKLMSKCNMQSNEIKTLKKKVRMLEKNAEKNIAKMSGLEDARTKDIVDCLVNGQLPRTKYPKHVREFALNLHYLSPRAYEFLRETFNEHLPHNSTLRKWYANSDLNSEAGITKVSLEFLKQKVLEKKKVGETLVCSVCYDEMAIRKQILWNKNLGHMVGYVTYGNTENDEPLVAKEAIVFIVSGLNERFSIPVAYHFVNSLNSTQKMNLVKCVLIALIETGMVVTSITFDGHPTNKTVCKMLGGNLNVYTNDFQPYFTLEEQQIFIFYDVCHNEKLVRGQLDKKAVLLDENNEQIRWSYIENLVKFGKEKGFAATHKLNRSHIQWRRRPMNVRIAVETLSKSTADSLEYLESMGYKEFDGVKATVYFIRLFNDLFDIFNTKFVHDDPNIYKNALTEKNNNSICALFNEAIHYIRELKFELETGKIEFMCKSDARTGFMGYIINMQSLKMMFEKYIEKEKILSYIPTYFLNQDAVEMFFGKIRSRGGCNDNPDVVGFQAAYRKLLGIDSILQSKKGNCEACQINADPFSDILYVSSRRDHTTTESENELIVWDEVDKLHEKLTDLDNSALSDLTDDLHSYTIVHIANEIEEKIKSTDNCNECVKVFDSCKKLEGSFYGSKFNKKPCLSTYKICKEADRFLKLRLLQGDFNFNTIYYAILNNLEIDEMYTESDFSSHASHKLYLIRAVVDCYVRIKGLFIARSATQDLHDRQMRLVNLARNSVTKKHSDEQMKILRQPLLQFV